MPLPGKFDDIVKTAKSVLDDDYQVEGKKIEFKTKTNFDGAVATTTIDFPDKLIPGTLAKLSWKFPKVFGPVLFDVPGISVDKLEFDKKGVCAFESSIKKDLHKVDGLALSVKSDLADIKKINTGATYTGMKDAMFKFEAKPLAGKDMLTDFSVECLYGHKTAVFGAKFKGANIPDLGVNINHGDIFASILAKKGATLLSPTLTGHLCYKVSDTMKVAGTCDSKKGSWQVGGQAKVAAEITAKAKLESTMANVEAVSFGIKKDIVKGLVLTAGGKYTLSDGKTTYGAKLVAE
jgi:hypothetical protein